MGGYLISDLISFQFPPTFVKTFMHFINSAGFFYTNYFFLINAGPILSKLLSKKYLQLSVREAPHNRKII